MRNENLELAQNSSGSDSSPSWASNVPRGSTFTFDFGHGRTIDDLSTQFTVSCWIKLKICYSKIWVTSFHFTNFIIADVKVSQICRYTYENWVSLFSHFLIQGVCNVWIIVFSQHWDPLKVQKCWVKHRKIKVRPALLLLLLLSIIIITFSHRLPRRSLNMVGPENALVGIHCLQVKLKLSKKNVKWENA